MPTTPGGLGRLVRHDPRSRGFVAPLAAEIHTVLHPHYGPVLDQGQVGSCTGNALAQVLNTRPMRLPRSRYKTEVDALAYYSRATFFDPYPGQYPPNDTGSSGLAVCKAGVEAGDLREYRHAFGLDQALAALTLRPFIVGTDWWTGMNYPDVNGFVEPGVGQIEGGHEYAVIGLNLRGRYVTALNSWSDAWGLRGRFRIRFEHLDGLLKADGDVTVPIPAHGPLALAA